MMTYEEHLKRLATIVAEYRGGAKEPIDQQKALDAIKALGYSDGEALRHLRSRP